MKSQLAQRFATSVSNASVWLARVFKLWPASLSQGDITAFVIDIKQGIMQMAINNTQSTLGDTPHFVVNGEDRRLPYELLEQSPRRTYTDDYIGRAIQKKQEIYRVVRHHLQFERDKIILKQYKLAQRKDIQMRVLIVH